MSRGGTSTANIARADTRIALAQLADGVLDDREREVIRLRFGSDDMSISPPSDFTSSERFRVETLPDRQRVLVAPHGELDVTTVQLEELVERGFRAHVSDLRRSTFIDSSAVHLLLSQTARADVAVSVIPGPRCVTRVLDIAGIRDVLRFEAAP